MRRSGLKLLNFHLKYSKFLKFPSVFNLKEYCNGPELFWSTLSFKFGKYLRKSQKILQVIHIRVIYSTTNCIRDYCCEYFNLKMEITFRFLFILSLEGHSNGLHTNICCFIFEMSIFDKNL